MQKQTIRNDMNWTDFFFVTMFWAFFAGTLHKKNVHVFRPNCTPTKNSTWMTKGGTKAKYLEEKLAVIESNTMKYTICLLCGCCTNSMKFSSKLPKSNFFFRCVLICNKFTASCLRIWCLHFSKIYRPWQLKLLFFSIHYASISLAVELSRLVYCRRIEGNVRRKFISIALWKFRRNRCRWNALSMWMSMCNHRDGPHLLHTRKWFRRKINDTTDTQSNSQSHSIFQTD